MSFLRAPPFQLLEINLISAQDLAAVSRSMRTYAVAWVHPQRKLRTRVDENGRTNPTWNENFVFRVDDKFLYSDNSSIMIEFYAVSWLRDVNIGTVQVLINNLIPHTSKSGMRFVALQVRRPSGRPQGILNMGVALLDSSMRSMPLYTDLSSSTVGYQDIMDEISHKQNSSIQNSNHKIQLRRSRSERSHTKDDSSYQSSTQRIKVKPAGSLCNGSDVGAPKNPGGGNGSLLSDVGPSPSVVAAAIAKGLYPTPAGNYNYSDEMGSSILEDWSESDSVEGLRSKLERWRTEMPPVFDVDNQKHKQSAKNKKHTRRRSDGGGRFSCFGKACGCEFSISCGGKSMKNKHGNGKVQLSPSEMDDLSFL